jgi:anthranilate phosphoribosyltransferase
MAGIMAEVFARRGDSVLVMRGEDGLDEFTTTAPTRIWAVRGGAVTETVVDAADLGLPRSAHEDLRGGDAPFNAQVARDFLAGKAGPVRDATLINAAAALVARGGWGDDLGGALRAGFERAAEAVDSGAAAGLLERWITTAQAVKPA